MDWLRELAEKSTDPVGGMSYRVRRYDGLGGPCFSLDFLELQGALRTHFKRIDALEALLREIVPANVDDEQPLCDALHHDAREQHDIYDPCPVIARFRTALKAGGE